jgi:hypothetical protein
MNPENSSVGWSMVNNNPATLSVTIGGNPARPLSQLVGDAAEKYVGRLDGKLGRLQFIPASEATEVRIEHLFDD